MPTHSDTMHLGAKPSDIPAHLIAHARSLTAPPGTVAALGGSRAKRARTTTWAVRFQNREHGPSCHHLPDGSTFYRVAFLDEIPYTAESPPVPRFQIPDALDTLLHSAIDDAANGKPGTAYGTLRKGIVAALEMAYATGEVAALKGFAEHMTTWAEKPVAP